MTHNQQELVRIANKTLALGWIERPLYLQYKGCFIDFTATVNNLYFVGAYDNDVCIETFHSSNYDEAIKRCYQAIDSYIASKKRGIELAA